MKIDPEAVNRAMEKTNLSQPLYAPNQEARLKAELELQHTRRQVQIMSRLYEQSCQEIFILRQQLNDLHQVLANLRATGV